MAGAEQAFGCPPRLESHPPGLRVPGYSSQRGVQTRHRPSVLGLSLPFPSPRYPTSLERPTHWTRLPVLALTRMATIQETGGSRKTRRKARSAVRSGDDFRDGGLSMTTPTTATTSTATVPTKASCTGASVPATRLRRPWAT